MRRTTRMLAAACVALAAGVALAQDADPETRFHRAYEQEVVDGKVADAAREYLAMMDDAKVPERLRLEAKFRFAVTAMLLGRADEARARFGELAADAKVPEALRARASEYLDAAKGVGVGNETDRKMQSLVFELAKDKEPTPAAYREFEVIGKRAVPFLRQLLRHEDLSIRTHAFRILVGMGEPGMVDVWTPDLTRYGYAEMALNSYLAERPDDRAAFERRLLALDDAALFSVLGLQSFLRPQYSAETLRAFAARKVPPNILLLVFPSNWTAETDRVRGEWIAGDDGKLSEEATMSYLASVKALPEGNIALRTDLFPAIVARLETMPLASLQPYLGTQRVVIVVDALSRLASAMPADAILDAFAKAVEHGAATPAGDANPLQSGLVHALARAYERRDPKAQLPARFGEILKTWFSELSKRGQGVPVPDFAWHVHAAAERMPEDAATALVVWAVTTPWKGIGTNELAQVVPTTRARDVPVAMAAARAAEGETRRAILNAMPTGGRAATSETPDDARAILRVTPEIVRLWIDANPGQYWPPLGSFIAYARLLPPEEARERVVETAEAVVEIPDQGKRQNCLNQYLLGIPAPEREDRTPYWREVALPSLDRVWPKLPVIDRVPTLVGVLSLLEKGPRDPGLRSAIANFVAAHYGEVPGYAARSLASSPDVFALTDWVPKVCPDTGVSDNSARVPSERADPAVREMTADPAAVNFAVLQFIEMSASPGLRTEVTDRLLRTCPVERLLLVSNLVGVASPDALEEALRRVLAEKAPDLRVVARLVARLCAARPSESLFPGVRLLLASGTTSYRSTGIETAKALGREELLPDLAALLDSMEPGIRNSAKDAIDSIVALRKLKDEARRGAGGK